MDGLLAVCHDDAHKLLGVVWTFVEPDASLVDFLTERGVQRRKLPTYHLHILAPDHIVPILAPCGHHLTDVIGIEHGHVTFRTGMPFVARLLADLFEFGIVVIHAVRCL